MIKTKQKKKKEQTILKDFKKTLTFVDEKKLSFSQEKNLRRKELEKRI